MMAGWASWWLVVFPQVSAVLRCWVVRRPTPRAEPPARILHACREQQPGLPGSFSAPHVLQLIEARIVSAVRGPFAPRGRGGLGSRWSGFLESPGARLACIGA